MIRHGGVASGEHGDGQSRGELLPKLYGEELAQRLPRDEGHLRPRQPDEPRQGGRSLPDPRRPAPRRRLPAVGAGDRVRVSRRRLHLLPRCAALRRRRQVPAPRRRHHVPELPGDRRGAALDPRARPAALRDAAGRGDLRRLAQRGGQAGARPLLRLQGVQERLPGGRRHGDLQGGVPVPPLLRQLAADRRLQHGWHLLVGAAGLPRAAAGQPRRPHAGRLAPRQAPRRHLPAPPHPGFRPPHLPRRLRRAAARFLGRTQRRHATGSAVGAPAAGAASSCGRTPSTTSSTRRSPTPPSRCSRPRAGRW